MPEYFSVGWMAVHPLPQHGADAPDQFVPARLLHQIPTGAGLAGERSELRFLADGENENGQARMKLAQVADEKDVALPHDFGDDDIRAQLLDGLEGGGDGVRDAADDQAGTPVDPGGGGVSHKGVAIHDQNAAAPLSLMCF
jgi:hypothetical protein